VPWSNPPISLRDWPFHRHSPPPNCSSSQSVILQLLSLPRRFSYKTFRIGRTHRGVSDCSFRRSHCRTKLTLGIYRRR
jgi:hypothetical protein